MVSRADLAKHQPSPPPLFPPPPPPPPPPHPSLPISASPFQPTPSLHHRMQILLSHISTNSYERCFEALTLSMQCGMFQSRNENHARKSFHTPAPISASTLREPCTAWNTPPSLKQPSRGYAPVLILMERLMGNLKGRKLKENKRSSIPPDDVVLWKIAPEMTARKREEVWESSREGGRVGRGGGGGGGGGGRGGRGEKEEEEEEEKEKEEEEMEKE
uniref:Uncharacterized protein n=1 Tax=Vespula pensylvanica TaxID=30213 RepID=A0A834U4G1_VESPE|nr:hypothetical protein H0235_011130 [Vespula pensylvanica]